MEEDNGRPDIGQVEKPGEAQEGQATPRRRAMLATAVTVVTLVVVAAWILTLPMQLTKLKLLNEEDIERWDSVRTEVNEENRDIEQAIDDLKGHLDRVSEQVSGEAVSSPARDEVVPEELANKIREKVQALEARESANQEESDATTQE